MIRASCHCGALLLEIDAPLKRRSRSVTARYATVTAFCGLTTRRASERAGCRSAYRPLHVGQQDDRVALYLDDHKNVEGLTEQAIHDASARLGVPVQTNPNPLAQGGVRPLPRSIQA